MLAVLAVSPAAIAQDRVFTVTRPDDPAPDGCRPDDCSLREAVEAANDRPGADAVALPAGVFELELLDRTNASSEGQGLYVTAELTLRGAGQSQTVIDLTRLPVGPEAGTDGRVGPGIAAQNASLTLEDLTMRDAPDPASEVGMLSAVDTAVTLRSVAILGAPSLRAISVSSQYGRPPLLIEDSLFADNAGGAVYYRVDAAGHPLAPGDRSPEGPRARVRRSVFRDNGGPALSLLVGTRPGDQENSVADDSSEVEDSEFHGNRPAIRASGPMRVSRSAFIGNSSAVGGAMRFGVEPVVLEEVLVEGNSASSFGGGVSAINLVVRDSVFRGNQAASDGGAIDMFFRGFGATLEASGSVFADNSAARGGAIRVWDGAARMTNVTFTGNVAYDIPDSTYPSGAGAALYTGGGATASLTHTTVLGSRGRLGALYTRGFIGSEGGADPLLHLEGSVVAGTAAVEGGPAPNCTAAEGGTVVSGGFNVVDDDSCGLGADGDRVGEPGLGPLVSTGGTFAHLPSAGGPLIDAVGSACPEVDQRGLARPVDGDGDGQALCDVGAVEALSGRVGRVSGPDRVATALAVSQESVGDQQADIVVLARSDGFADGLAGGPLAAAGDGPLLLTGRDALDPRVEAELARVLPAGGEVVVLGATAALRAAVEDRIAELGFRPVRVAGDDRYATAVAVARRLGDPALVLLASGTDFPDALSAGAAAATAGGAVLLTADDQLPAPTRTYLDKRPDVERVAVGGPAAAADPGAEQLVGPDRYATAVAVARRFHDQPATVGVASGQDFPDALAAGPDSAARGGPLLLSPPARLPDLVAAYLAEIAPTLTDEIEPVRVYGGEKALSLQVEADLDAVVSL